MSENDAGKASGWAAWYQDGKWVEDDKRSAKKPAKKTTRKTAKKK
jgi:DNA topoisomerase I